MTSIRLWLHPRVDLQDVRRALSRAGLHVGETTIAGVYVISPCEPPREITEIPALLRPQAE